MRFDNNEMICAIYLVGLPLLVAWCLYRIPNPTVRLGVLIGIAIGIPLSYFAQPASIQMAMPLPVYVGNLIESLDVWHNGRVTDFLRFTLPMWMTCTVMALAGAIGARFLGRTFRKHRLQNLEVLRRRGSGCENKGLAELFHTSRIHRRCRRMKKTSS